MRRHSFILPERAAADCSVCFAFHPNEGDVGGMVERYVFFSLRDFLYVELGKAILRVMKGNMSREDFNAWVEFAAGRRDTTLLLLEVPRVRRKRQG